MHLATSDSLFPFSFFYELTAAMPSTSSGLKHNSLSKRVFFFQPDGQRAGRAPHNWIAADATTIARGAGSSFFLLFSFFRLVQRKCGSMDRDNSQRHFLIRYASRIVDIHMIIRTKCAVCPWAPHTWRPFDARRYCDGRWCEGAPFDKSTAKERASSYVPVEGRWNRVSSA